MKRFLTLGCIVSGLVAPRVGSAAVYSYVDWTVADVASGTASGTITLPDSSTVQVTFVATTSSGAPGTLHGAQVSGGANYWLPSAPYLSAEVENAPPDTDLLQLAGGLAETYTVTLSEPIKDPVMAIVSLGQPGLRTTYDFDAPFEIVSQGVGYWGGSATALTALPGNVLEGYEGHGTLRFIGTFTTFSWGVPTPEVWHGFTFAIRTTERLEPTPDAGGDGAAGQAGAGGASDGGALDGGTSGGAAGASGGAAGASGGAGGASGGAAGASGGAAGANGGTAGSSAGTAGAGGFGAVGGASGSAGTGEGGTTTAGGSGGSGALAGTAGVGGAAGAAGSAAAGSSADAGLGGKRASARDDANCGCRLPPARGSLPGVMAAVALALGMLRARRRRARAT